MNAREQVDAAIDGYRGDDLHALLIGQDLWEDFLTASGLTKENALQDDGVVYRGVSCRKSVAPDGIKLLVGN